MLIGNATFQRPNPVLKRLLLQNQVNNIVCLLSTRPEYIFNAETKIKMFVFSSIVNQA